MFCPLSVHHQGKSFARWSLRVPGRKVQPGHEFTSGPEFAASYVSNTFDEYSLVLRPYIYPDNHSREAWCRDRACVFETPESDMSTKVAEIKEKGCGILHLLAKGEVTSVLARSRVTWPTGQRFTDAPGALLQSGLLKSFNRPFRIVFSDLWRPCLPWYRMLHAVFWEPHARCLSTSWYHSRTLRPPRQEASQRRKMFRHHRPCSQRIRAESTNLKLPTI
jgi:hypothetical protein